MLGIVETLKEFCTILSGQQLNIYTDHKNITCKNFNTDSVLWWRLILEKYNPEIEYIKREIYILEDALSRLHNRGNQKATHESTYTMETISELYRMCKD